MVRSVVMDGGQLMGAPVHVAADEVGAHAWLVKRAEELAAEHPAGALTWHNSLGFTFEGKGVVYKRYAVVNCESWEPSDASYCLLLDAERLLRCFASTLEHKSVSPPMFPGVQEQLVTGARKCADELAALRK